jgi:hypothetical protein
MFRTIFARSRQRARLVAGLRRELPADSGVRRLPGRFSDSLMPELVVITATTVFTYLAVSIIQRTQSRDARAMHLNLHELIN